jgi:CTP-dependent riboflavin kinase
MMVHASAYTAATGIALYPGSLNLQLAQPWSLPTERTTLRAEDVGRVVHLVPCTVRGRRCFIFRTDSAEHSGDDERRVVEILSDVRLRDELNVSDGDLVEVLVDGDSAETSGEPET